MITFKQFITEAFKPIPFIEGENHDYSVDNDLGTVGRYNSDHTYRSRVLVGGRSTSIETLLNHTAEPGDEATSSVAFFVNGRYRDPDIKRTHSEAMQIFNTVLGHIEHHMKLVSPDRLSFEPNDRLLIRGNKEVSDGGEGKRKIFQRMARQFGVKVNK